jgi:hypothetical protein
LLHPANAEEAFSPFLRYQMGSIWKFVDWQSQCVVNVGTSTHGTQTAKTPLFPTRSPRHFPDPVCLVASLSPPEEDITLRVKIITRIPIIAVRLTAVSVHKLMKLKILPFVRHVMVPFAHCVAA